MKKLLLFFLVLSLTGCLTSPAPNYINGRYYMAGDSDCIRGYTNTAGHLVCYNSKKQMTGTRQPISEMQARAWYNAKAQESHTYCNSIGGQIFCSSY